MCAQAHTNICLGAQTHTQVPVCLVEKTSACVRSLACTRRRVALSKFNSHMQTGKTHTLRPKACRRARDGLTRWRGIAGCRRRRPGVQGSRQGGPTPGETQVHEWGGWMGEGSGCESMTVSTGAAGASDGVTSTTLLRTEFCSQACSRLRQSAREQARRHRRIPSAGRHALPATSPQVPRCRADALSTRPCTLRLQQPAWQAAALRMRPLTCRSTLWALCQVPPITSSTLLHCVQIFKKLWRTEYLRIYSCGQITLDPQNFGRKQKRSKLQSDLVVRIFHTRLRLNSKIFVPGQKKVSCGHSHDEIRLGN